MHDHQSIVITILQEHFQTSDWLVRHPKDGQQEACFIARHGGQRVFVKLGVPVAVLQRLSAIGAAPRVLVGGVIEGVTYIVQEYIVGSYPDRRWFETHLPVLARFVRKYHDDGSLTEILSASDVTNYEEHIEFGMAGLEGQYRTLHVAELHTVEIEQAFDRLKGWSKQLQPDVLVPVHPDPNTKNILLGDDGPVMVDWDDIQLSDPMLDVGLLLWWYVSHEQWGEFFEAYGVGMDEAILERIFWWVARTSFAVALWQVEHGYDCRAFLQDFLAALNRESNPHRVIKKAR